jgi:hypothetical protein
VLEGLQGKPVVEDLGWVSIVVVRGKKSITGSQNGAAPSNSSEPLTPGSTTTADSIDIRLWAINVQPV